MYSSLAQTSLCCFATSTIKKKIQVADPARGIYEVELEDFIKNWVGDNHDDKGYVLSIHYNKDHKRSTISTINALKKISPYLLVHRKTTAVLFLLILITGLISYISPFINKNIIDEGVMDKNIRLVLLMLIAQFSLFTGSTVVGLIRSVYVVKLSNSISMKMLYAFLSKILKSPIAFFDKKNVGDVLQRLNDHKVIQTFLTSNFLTLLITVVNFIAFSAVLIYFNWKILAILIAFNLISLIWIILFFKKRHELNTANFYSMSTNQNNIVDILNGAQEIKLNNSEEKILTKWQSGMSKVLDISLSTLKVNQKQMIGSSFIAQIETMVITFVAAYDVIKGNMTLGMMTSITFVTGQVKSSISQFIQFSRSLQDSHISFKRIEELNTKEEDHEVPPALEELTLSNIEFRNVSFKYKDATKYVLNNINLQVSKGKKIALVGGSGSGKSTIIKLMLKYYKPQIGSIYINESKPLSSVSSKWIRSRCGIVLQDGYIFSDTILENVTLSEQNQPDMAKLITACKTVQMHDYIESLPYGYNTIIGINGLGLSGGQKQRLLIARALYKDLDIILFDEATSSLDSETEKIFLDNLKTNYPSTTIVMVAHRLSTIVNADKILVLKNGYIIEDGGHDELLSKRGEYYHLMISQLNYLV